MHKYSLPVWIAACATITTACVDSKREENNDGSQLKNSVESMVTIKSGFYGMTYGEKDESYEFVDVYSDFRVIATGENGDDTVYSGKNGFYQIELPKGDYMICSSNMRCMKWSLDTILQRCDYEQLSDFGWNCYSPAIVYVSDTNAMNIEYKFERRKDTHSDKNESLQIGQKQEE